MISILLSSRWLGFHKGLKVAAYRTRFETHESAQREIFCCIETYGRTSEPFVAKKLSVSGTYFLGALRQNKVGTPDNLQTNVTLHEIKRLAIACSRGSLFFKYNFQLH